MLTLTSLTIWLRWEQAVSGGSSFASSGGMLTLTSDNLASLVAVECSLSPLFQSGFAGSKLLAVDLASLVAVDLALLGASC